MKIKTASLTSKTRLDTFLKDTFYTDMSRTQVQKLIENGSVVVNDARVPKHCFITNKDTIEVLDAQIPKENQTKKPKVKKNSLLKEARTNDKEVLSKNKSSALLKKIKIIDETNDFVVIEKPSGIIVHPNDDKDVNPSVVDWVRAHYDLKNVGEDSERPGIVHRLDKDVSGLMLIAKTQGFYKYAKKLFQKRSITKKYYALVIGSIAKEHGTVDFSIERSRRSGIMAAKPAGASDSAKKSATLFDVLTRFDGYTLLDVQPLTGRTHQIRVHMRAIGHPIVGDVLYAINKHKWSKSLIKKTTDLGRVFLHAHSLSFKDMNKETHIYTSPLPKELAEFLKLFSKL